MIRKGRKTHPRMLANVLKAIADMKDNRGSSIRKIVEQVAHGSPIVNKAGKKPRNVTMQVRRALRHGVNTGLLVQHAGKYRLGLDEADSLPVKEVRRRRKGRKGRKGRGRRRRRGGRGRKGRRRSSRASSRSLSDSEASPVSDTSYTSVESEDAAARRSRKAKRTAPKNQPERSSSRKKKRVTEDDKDVDNYDNQVVNNQPECDNPDCLCNIKQEHEDHPERGLDDQGFNGGYIN